MIWDFLTLDFSLQAAGIAAIVWLAQKLTNNIANLIFDRRIFSPVLSNFKRKYKIYKSKAIQINAVFSVSYTPKSDLTVSSAIDKLEDAFQRLENSSGNKISIEDAYWSKSDREGKIEIYYSDQTELFNTRINLVRDTDSVREHPSNDPDKVTIGSIGLETSFTFSFDLLEDTLFNLSSLISYLERSFEDQIRGSFSNGRFIISPIETDLTIDDWVQEEQFDISLLLSTEGDDRTEVEFFSDRAIVKSNQREIDARTVRYVKELLLNYYL